MKSLGRAFAVLCIYGLTCLAWLVLGGVTMHRSNTQSSSLREDVHELWGGEHVQRAPRLSFEAAGGQGSQTPSVQPSATALTVDLALDQRLKGLTWYALYDVGFSGTWRYTHEAPEAGTLVATFHFPDPQGVFDNFRFLVNGEPVHAEPSAGAVTARVPVEPGSELELAIAYESRGLGSWRYAPSDGAGSLRNFRLDMNTNFDAVDFPESTLSPSTHEDTARGKHLVWDFEQVVTGREIGMVMPQRIQPGELASSLSFSAPISLLFFFLVIAVLTKLKSLEIHPVNYFFLGAAFFSFHLLFAYTVDHVSVWTAFALSSAVSVLMVTAYLRLVVSPRFAFVEAGLAQLVYLVGFSLAHFWQGMTGLTITVLSVGTLFLLMLLTGRIRWGQVLEKVVPPPTGFGDVRMGPAGMPPAQPHPPQP